jgi:hypothetical protein
MKRGYDFHRPFNSDVRLSADGNPGNESTITKEPQEQQHKQQRRQLRDNDETDYNLLLFMKLVKT